MKQKDMKAMRKKMHMQKPMMEKQEMMGYKCGGKVKKMACGGKVKKGS